MKKLLLSLIAPAIGLFSLSASAIQVTTLPVVGPITFAWQAIESATSTNHETISTNKVLKETNYTYSFHQTTKTVIINNATILALLTNSFKTNFPAGAKLAIAQGSHIYVVDKTGTNVVLDPSPVLTLTTSNGVSSGGGIETTTVKSGNYTYSGGSTQTETAFVTITYSDAATSTEFTVSGVGTGASDYNNHTDTVTENYSVPAMSGAGTIKGTSAVISGSVTASDKGFED